MTDPPSEAPLASTHVAARVRNPHLVHGLWIVAFLVLVAPTLVFLWEKWTRNIWYNGHGLLMPLILSFLGAHALRRRSVAYEEPSRWGFALLIPALSLLAIDSAIHTQLLSAFALLLALPGLSLLLLGVQRTRALAFPFFLSLFMLPIPGAFLQRLHLFLRELTTRGSEWVLHLFRLPAFVEGTNIYLPHGTLKVVEECSGFSALYAAVTIALVLAYLSRSSARRVVILLAAFPLALVCNVARVVLLAILVESQGYDVLDTPIHPLSGYVSFVLTLAALFLFAERRPRSAVG
jgi:exosortase